VEILRPKRNVYKKIKIKTSHFDYLISQRMSRIP
jgi:hypothetical protein